MSHAIDDVIGTIYDAALEPGNWSVALDRIIDVTGSRSGNLISSDRSNSQSSVAVFRGIDPDWIRRYNEHYYRYDPSMSVFARCRGKAVADQVTGPGREVNPRDARLFHNELMVPQSFHHTAGAGLFLTESRNAAIILQRDGRQGEYAGHELSILNRLTPHIRRALHLNKEHQWLGFRQGLEAAYENSHMGVILLNAQASVVYLNPKAEELLRRHPEIGLKSKRLSLDGAEVDARVQAMISEAINTANGTGRYIGASLPLSVSRATGPMKIQVSPVHSRVKMDILNPTAGHALVHLSDPRIATSLSSPMLAAYFNLTRSEASVLAQLCMGMTLEEIADARVRSIHTIRSQTKSVMRKLGVQKHADLVRVVLTSPVARPS